MPRGVHDFTFDACSGFTRVTARRVAVTPIVCLVPKPAPFGYRSGQVLSEVERGFGTAGRPAAPLGWLPPTRSGAAGEVNQRLLERIPAFAGMTFHPLVLHALRGAVALPSVPSLIT